MNRPTPANANPPPKKYSQLTDLPIKCEKPSQNEIKKAIMKLKKGKAAGADNIPAEVLKADIDTTVEMLYPLSARIWEDEKLPAHWKEGHLIKLPKKGDLSTCSNYRGISLLSVPRKVLERVKDTSCRFSIQGSTGKF